MELRDKIYEIVCEVAGDPNFTDTMDPSAAADAILAIPEIAEALEEAAFNRIMRKVGHTITR